MRCFSGGCRRRRISADTAGPYAAQSLRGTKPRGNPGAAGANVAPPFLDRRGAFSASLGFAAEKTGGSFLDVHRLKKSKHPLGMIEEKIDIGIFAGFVARRGAEQEQVLDTEPLKVQLVLF